MTVQKTSMRLVPRVEPSSGGPPGPPGPSIALFAVQNVAALEALDDSTFVDGTLVPMRSVLANWALVRTPNASTVVDNITVATTASGMGVWVRETGSNSEWLSRDFWSIDAIAGNDENDGATDLTALKTVAELERRIDGEYYLPTSGMCNIHIVGNLPTGWTFNGKRDKRIVVVVQGDATIVYSGTFQAGSTDAIPGANVAAVVVDAGIPAGLVEDQIVLSAGASTPGASCALDKAVGGGPGGAGAYRYPGLIDIGTFTPVLPVVGDPFDVVTRSTIAGTVIDTGGGDGILLFIYFDFQSDVLALEGANVDGGFGLAFSRMQNAWVSGGAGLFFIGSVNEGEVVAQSGGFAAMLGHDARNTFRAENEGAVGIFGASLGSTGLNPALLTSRGGAIFIGEFGVFDTSGPIGAIGAQAGCAPVALQGPLWGTGNGSATAIRIESGSTVVYGTVPNIIGPFGTADVIVGGSNVAFGALPFVDASTQSAMVLGTFF